jgi:four helix bundle protein
LSVGAVGEGRCPRMNQGFKSLVVYQKAYKLATDIFFISKGFPHDERYSLISQIRRSSRSVCTNIAEGYRKRQYPDHFSCKMSDADMENSETQVWLDFSLTFGYIDTSEHNQLTKESLEIGRMLCKMILEPMKFSKR